MIYLHFINEPSPKCHIKHIMMYHWLSEWEKKTVKNQSYGNLSVVLQGGTIEKHSLNDSCREVNNEDKLAYFNFYITFLPHKTKYSCPGRPTRQIWLTTQIHIQLIGIINLQSFLHFSPQLQHPLIRHFIILAVLKQDKRACHFDSTSDFSYTLPRKYPKHAKQWRQYNRFLTLHRFMKTHFCLCHSCTTPIPFHKHIPCLWVWPAQIVIMDRDYPLKPSNLPLLQIRLSTIFPKNTPI